MMTFYPTYEEWKHVSITKYNIPIFTFYPTSKEWKLRRCPKLRATSLKITLLKGEIM